MVNLISEFQKQEVQFKSLTDSIDTGTASGRFFSTSWRAWLKGINRWPSSLGRAETTGLKASLSQ